MTEELEEVSSGGYSSDLFSQPPIDDCKVELAESRRVTRKRILRSSPLSSRRAISSPKSPLMRMAEMRRGGLRGKSLRHTGKKGSEEMGSLPGKGKQGAGGRGSSVLPAIPECQEAGEGVLGGLGLEENEDGVSFASGKGELAASSGSGEGVLMVVDGGLSGEGASGAIVGLASEKGVAGAVGFPDGLAVVLLEDRILPVSGSRDALLGSGSGCSELEIDRMPDVGLVGFSSDLALDLISSQPLQDMSFIGERVERPREENVGKDCLMVEMGSEEASVGVIKEDFPLLSKENLRNAKDKERNRGVGGREVPRMVDHAVKVLPHS